MQNADDSWTFRSSAGLKRRIDFILYSSHLCCFEGRATNDLDLGPDHRAVYAGFTLAARGEGAKDTENKQRNGGNHWNQMMQSIIVQSGLDCRVAQ